jgi:hypothetical protein
MTVIIRRTVTPPVTPPVTPMTAMPAGRHYPDGTAIPATLPESYQPSHRCGNCAAFKAETRMCLAYNDVVWPDYVCAGWKAIAA